MKKRVLYWLCSSTAIFLVLAAKLSAQQGSALVQQELPLLHEEAIHFLGSVGLNNFLKTGRNKMSTIFLRDYGRLSFRQMIRLNKPQNLFGISAAGFLVH